MENAFHTFMEKLMDHTFMICHVRWYRVSLDPRHTVDMSHEWVSHDTRLSRRLESQWLTKETHVSVSHVSVSHDSHLSESCLTSQWLTSQWVMTHVSVSHDSLMIYVCRDVSHDSLRLRRESSTETWVMTHWDVSHDTLRHEWWLTETWVMMWRDSFTCMTWLIKSNRTRMNEACHTYEWVMSHVWMRFVTRMNESCHAYEWVMFSQMRMSHGTHQHKKCHNLTHCSNWTHCNTL